MMYNPDNFEWLFPLLLGGPIVLLTAFWLLADWRGWLG